MIAYFDSSALVKLLIDEWGSNDVVALWNAAPLIVTSRLAHPEVCAALAAAAREGRLKATEHESALSEWAGLLPHLDIIEVAPAVAEAAGRAARLHRLSGCDAVHLASAQAIPEAGVIFATGDRRLLTAARDRGMETLGASDHNESS